MQVLKLLNEHGVDLPFTISDEIGFGGADGQVFQLKDYSDKVVKLSVLFDYGEIDNEYERIISVLNWLKKNSPEFCAKIFAHGQLLKSVRKTFDGEQKFIVYFYVMEKCSKISEDEKKVFHSVLSHEDRNIRKTANNICDVLDGLKIGLDFNYDRLLKFVLNVHKTALAHNDLHPRNIMRNSLDDFVLIDFDRAYLRKNIKNETVTKS